MTLPPAFSQRGGRILPFLRKFGPWILQGLFVLYSFPTLFEPDFWNTLGAWWYWASRALLFPFSMAMMDGDAAQRDTLLLVAKVLAAALPMLSVLLTARRWPIFATFGLFVVTFLAPTYLRACPTAAHWVALGLLCVTGTFLASRPWGRWGVLLPHLVLSVLPWIRHEPGLIGWWGLEARCEQNDGVAPVNLDPSKLGSRYYGIFPIPPDWVLVMGEDPGHGSFLGIPQRGAGSWWLRRGEDGSLRFHRASGADGNVWTSCQLDGALWIAKNGNLMEVRPPGEDGQESVVNHSYPMAGFDSPGSACDEASGTVFVSVLGDGHLRELRLRNGDGQIRIREDSLSPMGGFLLVRQKDARLLSLDVGDLMVYDIAGARVLERLPVAIASSSHSLCEADGALAIADLGGRLRLFRLNQEGRYEFDWGLDLHAPRTLRFSPDCRHIGVLSSDDERVWIVERDSRQVVRTFRRGPALRGAEFLGPRELAVADACSVSVLHF